MRSMNMKLILAILALIAPDAASAAAGVTLESEVFVERTTADAAGKPKTILEAPKVVTPGDKLLFVISYKNGAAEPATGFVLTNPMPQAVAYAGSDASGADVSVDGGKNWGATRRFAHRQSGRHQPPGGSSRRHAHSLALQPGHSGRPGRQTELPGHRQVVSEPASGARGWGKGAA
jgi:hypothetical protein